DENASLAQAEVPVYASRRIGLYRAAASAYTYELADHLGNVRVVFTAPGGSQPTALSGSTYYPFGLRIDDLSHNPDYRFGYQGEFSEDETEETGWNSFEARMYDPVIGRWTTTDRARQHWSPYLAMSNNPILHVDHNGLTDWAAAGQAAFSLVGGIAETATGVPASTTGVGAYLLVDGVTRSGLAAVKLYHALVEPTSYSQEARDMPTDLAGAVGMGIDQKMGNANKQLQTTLGTTQDVFSSLVAIPSFAKNVTAFTEGGSAMNLYNSAMHQANVYVNTAANGGLFDFLSPRTGTVTAEPILQGQDLLNWESHNTGGGK
ncbi:MAG: hypothetical protein HC842_03450, partial [Cytophagales bacterium]|nr:hypothetical protein [Cytophagales bacterium]